MRGGSGGGSPALIGQVRYYLTQAKKVWGTIYVPHHQGEVKYDEGICV